MILKKCIANKKNDYEILLIKLRIIVISLLYNTGSIKA